MATNQGFKSLIPRPEMADAKYLYHWLRAKKHYLQALGNGATFKEVSKAVVARVEVPLPPLDEQRRIAAILDEADAVRAKRRHALTQVEALQQSIFVEMFGGQRLPERALRDLTDAEDRINYGVVQPGGEVEAGVPLIRVSDLKAGRVDRAGLKLIAPQVESQYERSRIRGSEILVSCVGSIGNVAVVSAEDVGSNVARAVARVPISDPDLRAYIAAWLSSPRVKHYFEAEVRTVAQPTLNIKQLAGTAVPVPPEQLVNEFGARVRALAPLLHRCDVSSRTLSRLSSSLTQLAFSDSL